MTGDASIGTMTLSTTPDHFTVDADATAAPMRPPMRACVDDDGSPSRHVSRFQRMAPTSAEKTITRPWLPEGAVMIPDPTVAATRVETSAPTTLSSAAMPSAVIGRNARVVIDTA